MHYKYIQSESSATSSAQLFKPTTPQKATKFHNFINSSNINRFLKLFYQHTQKYTCIKVIAENPLDLKLCAKLSYED